MLNKIAFLLQIVVTCSTILVKFYIKPDAGKGSQLIPQREPVDGVNRQDFW